MSSVLRDLARSVSPVPRTGGPQISSECLTGQTGQIGSSLHVMRQGSGEMSDSLQEPQQGLADNHGCCPQPGHSAYFLCGPFPETSFTAQCQNRLQIAPQQAP